MNEQNGSTALPDAFDRQLAQLQGLPDVVRTAVRTIRTIPPLGVGGSQVYIVQTYRQRDMGDTLFLEAAGANGTVRLVLPPAITETIARQRDALSAKNRRLGAREAVKTRAARGIVPAFLKKKRGKS
jgi:hypothetical protein